MAFSFVPAEDVKPLIKGNVTGWREELLEKTLQNTSMRLSAWFPGLKSAFDNADPDSELVNLVKVMVSEVAKKTVTNPDGMASETAGPYAYSRFDSEDVAKAMFNSKDLAALAELLNAERDRKATRATMSPTSIPGYPMPARGRYMKANRWWRT